MNFRHRGLRPPPTVFRTHPDPIHDASDATELPTRCSLSTGRGRSRKKDLAEGLVEAIRGRWRSRRGEGKFGAQANHGVTTNHPARPLFGESLTSQHSLIFKIMFLVTGVNASSNFISTFAHQIKLLHNFMFAHMWRFIINTFGTKHSFTLIVFYFSIVGCLDMP